MHNPSDGIIASSPSQHRISALNFNSLQCPNHHHEIHTVPCYSCFTSSSLRVQPVPSSGSPQFWIGQRQYRQTAQYPLHHIRRPGPGIGLDGVHATDCEAYQTERQLFPESFRYNGPVLSVASQFVDGTTSSQHQCDGRAATVWYDCTSNG